MEKGFVRPATIKGFHLKRRAPAGEKGETIRPLVDMLEVG